LLAAVTPERTKNLSGKALRVDSDGYTAVVLDVSANESDVLLTQLRVRIRIEPMEDPHRELAVFRGQGCPSELAQTKGVGVTHVVMF
jgi:hypothetical protein